MPDIRLELGARGEQWPAEQATVTSYAALTEPKPFKEPSCEVKVLAIERTFWETATILHARHPTPQRRKELESDYARMRQMIFGEVPTLDHVFDVLAELECKINENIS